VGLITSANYASLIRPTGYVLRGIRSREAAAGPDCRVREAQRAHEQHRQYFRGLGATRLLSSPTDRRRSLSVTFWARVDLAPRARVGMEVRFVASVLVDSD